MAGKTPGCGSPCISKGGAYFNLYPELCANTAIKDFCAKDEATAEFDVLTADVPAATAPGMFVIPELMQPLLNYAWHG